MKLVISHWCPNTRTTRWILLLSHSLQFLTQEALRQISYYKQGAFQFEFFIYVVHPLLECEQWEGQTFGSDFTDLLFARLFFLDLENTESVPVCTNMLPAWTMNAPFQLIFLLWKYMFEMVIGNHSLHQIWYWNGVPFLQRILTKEKLLQNHHKN